MHWLVANQQMIKLANNAVYLFHSNFDDIIFLQVLGWRHQYRVPVNREILTTVIWICTQMKWSNVHTCTISHNAWHYFSCHAKVFWREIQTFSDSNTLKMNHVSNTSLHYLAIESHVDYPCKNAHCIYVVFWWQNFLLPTHDSSLAAMQMGFVGNFKIHFTLWNLLLISMQKCTLYWSCFLVAEFLITYAWQFISCHANIFWREIQTWRWVM